MWKAPVLRRGIPRMFLEGNAEAVLTLEPAGIPHVFNSPVCSLQVIDCLLKAYGGQVAVGRHAGLLFEASDKVR